MKKNPENAKVAIAQIWAAHLSIFAQMRPGVLPRLKAAAKQKRDSFEDHSPGESLDFLCEKGCHELPLLALMSMVQLLSSFDEKWKRITGTTRKRKQMIGALDNAAIALEKLLSSIDEVIAESDLLELDGANPLRKPQEQLVSSTVVMPKFPSLANVPDFEATIRALKTFSSALQLFELSNEDAGITRADMFAKYLFSAYVYRATNKFHDERVANLIGAAVGITYDATAHRAWRGRNYHIIDRKLFAIADMLAGCSDLTVV